jgi:hypothetical protein
MIGFATIKSRIAACAFCVLAFFTTRMPTSAVDLLIEKREKWGTPVSDWSELRDEPRNHRTLGEGGHPP